MRVVFVLPCSGKDPIGGLKVVYEYANHLSCRGHEVSVVHAAFQRIDTPLIEKPRRAAFYWKLRLNGKYTPASWFEVAPSVNLLWVPTPHSRSIPDADVVVATSWDTAEWVNQYPETKGRKFYLIQGLESWSGPEERVLATWKAPLHKIVIARWLERIATDLKEESALIPNGLDSGHFNVEARPEDRNPNHLMMLFHSGDWKGSPDGLQAIQMVRNEIPELRATMFGVRARPSGLPAWIEYRQTPKQSELRGLYNQAAIFVAPSWNEGWGLPPSEAMMCGAAVAATDIGGHREFAFHEETALLSPPKDPRSLADNIIRLIRDRDLRIRLAKQGNANIQQFTWDRATDAFERAIADPKN